MDGSSFNIDLYRGTWTSYVVCNGEFDVRAAATLQNVLVRAVQRSSRTVIFNGIGITLLTTEIIDVLTEAALACRETNLNFELILSERNWELVGLLGVAPLLSSPCADAPSPDPEYEIPREVAQALCDLMDERDLYDAFFRDYDPGSSWDRIAVTAKSDAFVTRA